MTIIFGLIPIFVGLTFIVLQSKLCNGLTTYQNETYQTSCTVDQGGLVVIAAAIFWSVTFLISVVYIKDPKRDVGIRNGQITNAFETRQEERHLREMERRVKVQERREQRQERRNQRRKENGGSDNNDHDLRLEQDISDFDEDGEV